MPFNNSSTSRTRTDYHETEADSAGVVPWKEDATEREIETGHYREAYAERIVQKENELIWAWSRDPETDLTQIQARDRAQTYEYGRYNISQSSISRMLSTLDETMLTGGVIRLDGAALLDEVGYDTQHRDRPALLDRQRQILARFLCDRHALRRFDSGGERTPEWAQDRFPELDPNIGRKGAKRLADRTTDSVERLCGGLHEPHE